MNQSKKTGSPSKTWPDYRAVWRWHFYASLFCMPLVIVLAISGSVYLFKPQLEAWIDRPYDRLTVNRPASVAEQVRAALAAVPGSTPRSYEIPATEQSAARVIVDQHGTAIRVYVHPETLAILHKVPEQQRLMRLVFRIHGELMMGNWGSHIVELAACWTIVMILTGIYLWWPRQKRGWGGVLYPRLFGGSHRFWRDMHSVVGVWISWFALILLLTGLPWANFWGGYFKKVRWLTGTAVAEQDWSTGSERESGRATSGAAGGGHGEHGDHDRGNHGGQRGSRVRRMPDLSGFDRVVAAVRPLQLDAPVVVSPPRQPDGAWSAKSMTANRPRRVNLEVDGQTGTLLSRENFADRHWIDRVVGTGIALHEGQLFGWPNQLLGLITAAGLVLMCVSGPILWWRRREPGKLGAPKPLAAPRFSWGLLALVIALAIYLPLFGASLVVVLLAERLVLRRIARVREWLGLYAAQDPAQAPAAEPSRS